MNLAREENGDESMTGQRRNVVLFITILSLGIIALYFSFQSNADVIQHVMENNRSGDDSKNMPIVNNSQNKSNNNTKNVVSIPLKKPPFIKDE